MSERNDLITCTKSVKNTNGPFEIRSLRCITLDNTKKNGAKTFVTEKFFFENFVLDILCPEEIIK